MSTFGLAVDPELQAKLAAKSSQIVMRRAHERLFCEGEESNGAYLVKHGTLCLSLETSPGRIILKRVVGPGYLVGVPATINGHSYSLDCVAVEDAELAYLSRTELLALIQSDTVAAMKLLDLLSCEIQALRTALCYPDIRKGSGRVRKGN